MFAGKARSFPRLENLKGLHTLAYYNNSMITAVVSFVTLAPGRTCKHLTRLERPEKYKHSSLLQKFVNYRQFYNMGPGWEGQAHPSCTPCL